MAYYFQKIDTVLSLEQREAANETILYNLDEFHTIRQFGTEVRAKRGEKATLIAHCQTVEAARYIIENILHKRTITIEDVMVVEEGAS